MADKTIQDTNTTLLTALGGSTADGDNVYIDRYGVQYADADLSGSSRDLALVEITPGFTGKISAGTGGQLKVVCNRTSTGILRNRSRSQRIEAISTSSAGIIYNVINDPESNGELNLNTCATENAYAVTGTLTCESGVDLEQAYCYSGGVLNLRYATYVLDYVYARGGKVLIERDFVSCDVEGDAEVTINDTRVTPATAINLKGGTLVVKRMGTCALIAGGAGVIDFTSLETPVTISARSCEPGVTIKHTKRSYSLVTWTATAGDTAGGPTLEFVDRK